MLLASSSVPVTTTFFPSNFFASFWLSRRNLLFEASSSTNFPSLPFATLPEKVFSAAWPVSGAVPPWLCGEGWVGGCWAASTAGTARHRAPARTAEAGPLTRRFFMVHLGDNVTGYREEEHL